MSTPNIQIQVEPFESGKVVFLPMAPLTSQAKARGRVVVLFQMINNEASSVEVTQVTISFPGSSLPAETRIIKVSVGTGKSTKWWFQKPQDDIVFDLPGPAQIKFSFQCTGFTQPKEFTFGLAPHVSPVAGGAYRFPARASDLALGEFWQMNGCTHAMGAQGSQSFAYDMGVWGVNHDDGSYGGLLPGKDGTKNDHHRIWGKGVYAIADGAVTEALNDCPNNPAPLQWTDEADLQSKMKAQKDMYWGSYQHGGAGNHFYIQHGDEVVLYAHMQQGSLNANLLAPGSTVKAGDLLGRAGNSGNSTSPHLHIHAIQGTSAEDGPLRPFLWKDAWAIDNDLVIKDPRQGFWSKIQQRGIPEGNPQLWDKGDCFLWPGPSLPEWPELVRLSVPETGYQAVFAEMAKNGFRPVWIDAHTLGQQTFFNVIFRPATGVAYVARHGLDGKEYQDEFDKWVKGEKFRLVHVESYFSFVKQTVCYAPLFMKSAGPAFVAYHGKTEAEHQGLLDDLTKNQGFVPVNISVVSSGGQRFHAALYEKRDVGTSEARSTLSVEAYQQKFTVNAQNGLHLAYVNSYLHQGSLNIVAIWYKKIPSPFVQHHLDTSEFNEVLKAQRKANLYLRAITGYQRGAGANFLAIWNK